MTRRAFFGAAAILSIATVGAVASAAGPAGDEARAEPRAGRRGARLAEYLGLTDRQKADWRALHEQRRAEMRPVIEEGRALRKRLREAVDAPSPDAEAVGEATLALRAHHEKAHAQREAFRQKFEALLDPAQKERLTAFDAARGMGSEGRRGRRFRR